MAAAVDELTTLTAETTYGLEGKIWRSGVRTGLARCKDHGSVRRSQSPASGFVTIAVG
jgi:hypothetical protein